MLKRIALYLVGCIILAAGINFSKLAGLGISPSSSLPRALEVTLGITLGTAIVIVYCLIVLIQFLIQKKDFKPISILGIPVGIVFGFIVDFVGIDPNAFGHLMAGVPRPDAYIMRLVYLAISLCLIGTGVSIYVKQNLVNMPPEGLSAAISQKTGKAFGDCKTLVDSSLTATALIIQLIVLGGLKSFTGDTVIVREGTIISAFAVGQIVKLIRKYIIK